MIQPQTHLNVADNSGAHYGAHWTLEFILNFRSIWQVCSLASTKVMPKFLELGYNSKYPFQWFSTNKLQFSKPEKSPSTVYRFKTKETYQRHSRKLQTSIHSLKQLTQHENKTESKSLKANNAPSRNFNTGIESNSYRYPNQKTSITKVTRRKRAPGNVN